MQRNEEFQPSAPPAPPPPGFIIDPPSYSVATSESHLNVVTEQPSVPAQPPAAAAMVQNIPVGRFPERMTCPLCQNQIVTVIRTEPTVLTHVACLLCCLVCCCLCALCVYNIKDCLLKKHYCPKCNAYLGEYM